MNIFNKIKCFLGFHKFEQVGGPINSGNGKFVKRFRCKICNKLFSKEN